MVFAQLVHPTAGGLACAVGAIVAGAPIFSDGLHAARLGRHLADLSEQPIGEELEGFVHVSGTVALESPLFTPLTAKPCAAFRLDVRAIGAPLATAIEERRFFRVAAGGASALVASTGGRWSYTTTAERAIRASEPLTDHLEQRLDSAPRVRWWRRSGHPLRLTEHALLAGGVCHVVGFARRARPLELPLEYEVAQTGTDATVGARVALTSPLSELWLGPGESLDFLVVSPRPPRAADLAVPRWRTLGTLVGPTLTLAGLLYLASAAESLRSLGRF
jgi:hypothetical protein